MTSRAGDTMTPVAPPFMALALNPGLPRVAKFDQKSI